MTEYQFLETLLDENQKKHKNIIQKICKDKGLQIIIKCNQKIVGYLEITLNLDDGTCSPFHKANGETFYISIEYDHPLKIIKKILKSTEERLSHLT